MGNVKYPKLHQLSVFAHPLRSVAPAAPAVEHEAAIKGVILDGQEAHGVRPILEERPLGQQLVQPGGGVIAQAAPQHQIWTARHHVDGVDLE
jgi:hypothetical protein